MNEHKHRNLNQKGVLLMTSNWKTMRNTLVWLLVAVITMAIVVSSPYVVKTSAASLPTVKSCKSLTVKQSGKDWVTVNAKGSQVNYTGVAQNKNGWWRIENGKVNFKATGVYQNDYGWWRVETGKVNFKANKIYQNSYGWWKTTDGKVTFKENGVFQNDLGWWKVKDSKVDFSFTGIASNSNGFWYIEEGKVRFDKNGSTIYNGKNYIIKNGKAIPTDIKPDDQKPDDIKPDDVKPDDQKPDDVKPDDQKPDDQKPDDVKPDDQKDRREEAVEFVKEVLKEVPLSRAAMIDLLTDEEILEDDVFTKEEATYGVDHAGVNWDDQAVLATTLYLLEEDAETPTGLSRALLIELLKEDQYTDGNINHAMSIVDKDYPENSDFWKQSALISAQDIADEAKADPSVSLTRDDIKNVLKEAYLFTDAQAAYGAENAKL